MLSSYVVPTGDSIIIIMTTCGTDCHLSLRVVQNFYTSQSLGGSIDPQPPPPTVNDAPDMNVFHLAE